MLWIAGLACLQALVIAGLLVERRRARHAAESRAADARPAWPRTDLNVEQRLQEIAHGSRAAALGEMAAALAHELNQPMTAILSNAQAARNFLAAGSAEDIDEVRLALDDIVSDDRRASEIIKGMRALLKKDATARSVFDLNESVADAARLAASAALMRRVSISLDLARHLPPVSGDRVQVQQVVLNLVMNAVEAAAGGPAGRRLVRLDTRALKGELHLTVSDSGPGIPEDRRSRIFEPFFTTKAEGLGMGLAISRTIVAAHNGRIWVESAPEGATFHVALPPAIHAAAPAPGPLMVIDRSA